MLRLKIPYSGRPGFPVIASSYRPAWPVEINKNLVAFRVTFTVMAELVLACPGDRPCSLPLLMAGQVRPDGNGQFHPGRICQRPVGTRNDGDFGME